ncbi:ABC-2 type transporter [Gloeobacter kilaueensis JS1]|uniref:ABC-2 type transporter n=1 Tax=Gloeobacter kilaueensis (strain ATCC BAA-2537 / CCAP 1431/1 / ULC 316 / JS1) TaxID=1183438 RepID=U5QIR4_GLOK1|nr:ABC transporter permease [Gloeobacter kilaueensis]AGY57570.1 ABC-2 type transporter [Gloeobacter kilaueensis JS1]
MIERIVAQCVKELRQFSRDRLTVALAVLLPLGTLIIFGFAIRLEATDIGVAVQDLDQTPTSRAYIERVFATNQLQPVNWNGEGNPEAVLDASKAKAVLLIPPDFSRRLKSGKIATVQLLVDGTDANNARIIRNSIRQVTNFFTRTTGLASEQAQPIALSARLWFNPGRKESLYVVPGVFAVILAIYPPLLTAIAMVREKEQGTIVQVYASSLSAVEFLLGKGLAYCLVGLGEALAVGIIGVLLFGLRLAGDPTPLLIGTLLFIITSVAYGLLIGTRTATQSAAVQAVATSGFLTSLLLSGFIYPLSNIPFPLSLICNIVPARYYIEITRDAFVRGTGWASVWFVPPALLLLGCFFFAVSFRSIKRMQLPG